MYYNLLFLMSNPNASNSQGSGTVNLIILALAMLVFYFLMIRPKNCQIKKQREFLNKLETGLRVVTTAGIHGKISRLNDDNTIDVEISHGTYVKMEKSAISLEMTELLQKSLPLNNNKESKEENKYRNNRNSSRDKSYNNRTEKKVPRRDNRDNNRRDNNNREDNNYRNNKSSSKAENESKDNEEVYDGNNKN